MNRKRSRWFRWQRGQAMAEYWVTIPAGIIIMLSAAAIVQFVTGGLSRAVEGLEYTGDMECEMSVPDEHTGPLYTDVEDSGHTIQVTLDQYDEETDTTTIAVEVTSGGRHAISNWVLALPPEVYNNIISSSEEYEIVKPDPNSGLYGIKFDTGYDGDSDGGKPPKKKSASEIVLVGYNLRAADSRTIILSLAGYYQWDITELSVKAAGDVFYGTITAPKYKGTPPTENDC